MSDYAYGLEKLYTAMTSLAGSGSQQERLVEALAFSLQHIRPEHLPPEMHEEFKQFMSEMTCKDETQPGQGRVEATVQSLGDFDLHEAVQRLISLYGSVCHHMPKEP